MDKHLAVRRSSVTARALGLIHPIEALAPKYFNTRFLRVFVENVPFLVEKLGIKILPCVICFIKGISKDRHVQHLTTPLLILTSQAELSASRNWEMWIVLAPPPWSFGCNTQVRVFPTIQVHDLISGLQVLFKRILISCLSSTMHKLWYPTEIASARVTMMMTMTTLTFE